jgi:predicted RNase H-like HicB family nuclease
MKVKVVVHEAEEGGYWAEVPAIPGCATQGDTFQELLKNLYEAVEGCLSVDVSTGQDDRPRPGARNSDMKALSGKELARLLEGRGWKLLRVHGSHYIYGKTGLVCAFPFLCMETNLSKLGCCDTC